MDKYIYDDKNGLWYELQGDYYIPYLTLPTEKENKPIGWWGQRHRRYLQEHQRVFLHHYAHKRQIKQLSCPLVFHLFIVMWQLMMQRLHHTFV